MTTSSPVLADDGAAVEVLRTEELPGIPGKEAVMLTVTYPPGGSSMPHRHDAHVFVYVLEGSVVMQVDGEEPVTLRRGQTFHEKPSDVHRRSANASGTEPAKFLVFIVKDKGAPVSRPAE
ncbi:MAG: cupin domain-containing protein [Pseudomonadota bacterium]